MDVGAREGISVGRRGFSLVELLAVVLILAVLACIAVPMYVQERQSSAARACKYNLRVIASAQSAYALRFGSFCVDTTTGSGKGNGSGSGNGNGKGAGKGSGGSTTSYAVASNYVAAGSGGTPSGGLIGAPEGLASCVQCPLDGSIYTCTPADGGATVEIKCPNRTAHAAVFGSSGPASWQQSLTMARE